MVYMSFCPRCYPRSAVTLDFLEREVPSLDGEYLLENVADYYDCDCSRLDSVSEDDPDCCPVPAQHPDLMIESQERQDLHSEALR